MILAAVGDTFDSSITDLAARTEDARIGEICLVGSKDLDKARVPVCLAPQGCGNKIQKGSSSILDNPSALGKRLIPVLNSVALIQKMAILQLGSEEQILIVGNIFSVTFLFLDE